jgi:hypothetical protein
VYSFSPRNESNKTKKKQCDSKTKRMRRERIDIERERMQAYREMPVTMIDRDVNGISQMRLGTARKSTNTRAKSLEVSSIV